MPCRAEFMIEPFQEGSPGPHVMAGVDAVRELGFEPEMGPFGTSIEGEPAEVIPALKAMLETAYQAGAIRVSVQVEMVEQ